jgi:hypothetical protein
MLVSWLLAALVLAEDCSKGGAIVTGQKNGEVDTAHAWNEVIPVFGKDRSLSVQGSFVAKSTGTYGFQTKADNCGLSATVSADFEFDSVPHWGYVVENDTALSLTQDFRYYYRSKTEDDHWCCDL